MNTGINISKTFDIFMILGFYCQQCYHLLKMHQTSTLSAISQRDMKRTIIVHGISFHCQNSRNSQPTIAIQTANNKRRLVFMF
jgi:hypothetical protein